MHDVSATITHKGHELYLTGTFYKGCPAHWSDWDGGYPGEPDYIDDISIFMVRGKKRRKLQDPEGDLAMELHDKFMEALDE